MLYRASPRTHKVVGMLACWLEVLTVNCRVAWADKRENQAFALNDTRIIVNRDEQGEVVSMGQFKHHHPMSVNINCPLVMD
jgi:hypothetical protein